VHLYSAFLRIRILKALRHVSHVLPANYTMPAFPSQALP